MRLIFIQSQFLPSSSEPSSNNFFIKIEKCVFVEGQWMAKIRMDLPAVAVDDPVFRLNARCVLAIPASLMLRARPHCRQELLSAINPLYQIHHSPARPLLEPASPETPAVLMPPSSSSDGVIDLTHDANDDAIIDLTGNNSDSDSDFATI